MTSRLRDSQEIETMQSHAWLTVGMYRKEQNIEHFHMSVEEMSVSRNRNKKDLARFIGCWASGQSRFGPALGVPLPLASRLCRGAVRVRGADVAQTR